MSEAAIHAGPGDTGLAVTSNTTTDGGIFIAWKRDCFRSLQTAHILGSRLVLIWPLDSRNAPQTILRYALSAVQTIGVLLRERPRHLTILNLPVPLALIAWAYARLSGAALVLDCHSKPYADDCPRWERAIYPALSRYVRLNINHNEHDAAVVRAWGGRTVVIEALPFVLPVAGVRKPEKTAGVLCVCSFAPDEPVDVIIAAARAAPEIEIRITGNYRKRAELRIEDFPPNLHPTGYLSTQDYYDAMAGSAAVLSLSRNNWIMHMASEEALLLGIPVVVSHSAVVEHVLVDAGIFVELTPESVVAGLRKAMAERDAYAARMTEAADRQRARVEAVLASGLMAAG